MRKIKLALFCLPVYFLFAFQAMAVTHIITVSDFQFSPDTLTVSTGDTVTWQWLSGFHTTTANGIPDGAQQWNEIIDSLHPQFSYLVSKAGTYHYISIPDLPGMTGKFTLPGPVAISPVLQAPFAFEIAGNPVRQQVHIVYSVNVVTRADLALYSLTGIRLQTFFAGNINTGKHENSFELKDALPAGMYMVVMQTGNFILTRKLMVQQ